MTRTIVKGAPRRSFRKKLDEMFAKLEKFVDAGNDRRAAGLLIEMHRYVEAKNAEGIFL